MSSPSDKGAGAPDHLDVSMHAYYRNLLALNAAAGRPSLHALTPDEGRALVRDGLALAPPQTDLPELASIANETIPGPAGPIPVRRYHPKGHAQGICVYFHGGGWVIGDIEMTDALCRRLADGAACEVVSVDYRLAPEHPYPAPLDDAFAAVTWAAAQGRGPVLVAGDSAGGNLAAACAIRARDSGGPALAGQVLAYPVTDHEFETGSYRDVGERSWLLSTRDMKYFWDHYCPPAVNRADPLISPLRVADPAGLAPAMICLAALDPLRDEGIAYATRLAHAGVAVSMRCDAGMMHGYFNTAWSALPTAAEAVGQAAAWMKARIREAG